MTSTFEKSLKCKCNESRIFPFFTLFYLILSYHPDFPFLLYFIFSYFILSYHPILSYFTSINILYYYSINF